MITSLELTLRNAVCGSKTITAMDFTEDSEEKMVISSESFQLVIESSTLVVNYQKIITVMYYSYIILVYI